MLFNKVTNILSIVESISLRANKVSTLNGSRLSISAAKFCRVYNINKPMIVTRFTKVEGGWDLQLKEKEAVIDLFKIR